MSIGKRLKDARISRGITQAELAEGIGCSIGTISRIETNPEAQLSDIYLHKAAKVLSCRETWLRNGTGAIYSPTQTQSALQKHHKCVPVLSLKQVAENLDNWAHIETDTMVNLPFSIHSEQSFAVKVPVTVGGAHIPDNSIVIVEPKSKAKAGDFIVLFENDKTEAMIKKLVNHGGTSYATTITSEALPILEITSSSIICGVIKESIIRF